MTKKTTKVAAKKAVKETKTTKKPAAKKAVKETKTCAKTGKACKCESEKAKPCCKKTVSKKA